MSASWKYVLTFSISFFQEFLDQKERYIKLLFLFCHVSYLLYSVTYLDKWPLCRTVIISGIKKYWEIKLKYCQKISILGNKAKILKISMKIVFVTDLKKNEAFYIIMYIYVPTFILEETICRNIWFGVNICKLHSMIFTMHWSRKTILKETFVCSNFPTLGGSFRPPCYIFELHPIYCSCWSQTSTLYL
jgi:hypothetical protein